MNIIQYNELNINSDIRKIDHKYPCIPIILNNLIDKDKVEFLYLLYNKNINYISKEWMREKVHCTLDNIKNWLSGKISNSDYLKIKDNRLDLIAMNIWEFINGDIILYNEEYNNVDGNEAFYLFGLDHLSDCVHGILSNKSDYISSFFEHALNDIIYIKNYIDNEYIIKLAKVFNRKTKQFNLTEHNNTYYEKILKQIIFNDYDKLQDVDKNQMKDIIEEFYNIEIEEFDFLTYKTIQREFI